MVRYVDAHRDEFGVEPICRALQVAPSTYYSAKSRPASARAVRDAVLMQVLMVLWVTNRKVYGAHKLWKAAQRAGHEIGRDQVARLMRELAIEGVSRRRKKVFTTRQDPDALRAPDLVNRNFTADRPDALWVTDLTYVPTRSGMAYVCFIVDAFSRRIVGWRVASNMKTEMVLDALEMARRSRGGSPTRRAGDTLRCRVAIYERAIHGTSRRDRCASLDRHRRGQLRQRAGGDDQRPLQDRARLTGPTAPAGTTSTNSSSRPCHGCTGSTRTGSMLTATTSRPPSSRPRSTLRRRPPAECSETNPPSLQRDPGRFSRSRPFLFERPDPSTRTRAAKVAGTSSTRSPAATSCCASR